MVDVPQTQLFVQGTANRTQQQLELEIENMGGHLNAYTSVRAPFLVPGKNLLIRSARKHCILRQVFQLRRSSYGKYFVRHSSKLQARAICH